MKKIDRDEVTRLVLDQNSSGELVRYMQSLYTKERDQTEVNRMSWNVLEATGKGTKMEGHGILRNMMEPHGTF